MFIAQADCLNEQQMINGSELITIPSLWGHFSMLGVASEDFHAINKSLANLLEIPA